ncbi:MAG: histidine kinase dimerization/phosphoacceptor domain -containing protein [Flavobacteriales bacterium]
MLGLPPRLLIITMLFLFGLTASSLAQFGHEETTTGIHYESCLRDLSFSDSDRSYVETLCRLDEAISLARYVDCPELIATLDSRVPPADSMLVLKYWNIKARYLKITRHYIEAANLLKRIIEFYEDRAYRNEAADAIVSLAEFYRTTGQFALAKSQLERVIRMNENASALSPKVLARAWHRYAAVEVESQRNMELGIEYSKRSLEYSQKAGLIDEQATSFNELGYAYFNLKDHKKALSYLSDAVTLWKKLRMPHYEANSRLNIARIYCDADMPECEPYLDSLLTLCLSHDLSAVTYLVLDLQASQLLKHEQYKEAFVLRDSAQRVHDDIIADMHRQDLAEISARYQNELALKQLATSETERTMAVKSAENERQLRLFAVVALVISLLAIVGLVVIYSRLRARNKSMDEQREHIAVQYETLQTMLDQKEALLQEVHHRVKNNLQFVMSLIQMQLDNETKHDTKLLTDISMRVSAIALVHERLYDQEDSGYVLIDEYLDRLMENINTMVNTEELPIKFELDIATLKLDISKSISLGMICSELVTNSIKYAFKSTEKPRICVRLSADFSKKEITFEVSDNGSGFSGNQQKGLGSRLIDMFSRQLKAKAETISDGGIHYRLWFPL